MISQLWTAMLLGFLAGIPFGVSVTLAISAIRERRERAYRDYVRRMTWIEPHDHRHVRMIHRNDTHL